MLAALLPIESQEIRQEAVEARLVVGCKPADAFFKAVPVQVSNLEAKHDASRAQSVFRGRVDDVGALETSAIEVSRHGRDDAKPVVGFVCHNDAGPSARLVMPVLGR